MGCVDTDLACVACGYNLRTQPVSGRCPECATAAHVSLRARPLSPLAKLIGSLSWVALVAAIVITLVVVAFDVACQCHGVTHDELTSGPRSAVGAEFCDFYDRWLSRLPLVALFGFPCCL